MSSRATVYYTRLEPLFFPLRDGSSIHVSSSSTGLARLAYCAVLLCITVAAAFVASAQVVAREGTYLMVWEDQSIGKHDILAPTSCKDDYLGDVVARQGLHALVDFLRLLLVAAKSHNTKLGLDLAGINLDDADAGGDEFFAEGVGEGADGGFGCTVDAAALIRLAASDGADIDDITAATVGAGLEDGEDGLGHVDEAGDVGREHDIDVVGLDVRGLRNALDEASIVHQDVDILEVVWQLGDKAGNLVRLADIELDWVDVHAASKAADFAGDFMERVNATGGDDELQVVGLGAGKLEGDASPNARAGACDDDGLALEPLGH